MSGDVETMKTTDDILAELEKIGALGVPGDPPPFLPRQPDFEQTDLVFQPQVAQALELARSTRKRIREVAAVQAQLEKDMDLLEQLLVGAPIDMMGTVVIEPAESPQEPSNGSGGAAHVVQALPASEQLPRAKPRTYEEARAAAIAKIQGKGASEAMQTAREEEASIPYVGQDRARPEADLMEQEVTIGTVGTITPDLPQEV
jgi:hypothetical protein